MRRHKESRIYKKRLSLPLCVCVCVHAYIYVIYVHVEQRHTERNLPFFSLADKLLT